MDNDPTMKIPITSIIAATLLAVLFSVPTRASTSPAEKPMAAEPAITSSALRWENPSQEADSKIGQKILRAAYRFTNTGSNPISIIEIKPSCACVSTELDKVDYAPGESGEIKVTFDLEMDDAVGLQARTILVTANDAPQSPTKLRLLVHVPESVDATPEGLTWERGEKPQTKETVVKAGQGIAAMKLSLVSTNNDFVVEIAPKVQGQSYCVKVTPKTTAAPCYAQFQLKAESVSFGRPLNCQISAYVK
jgi:hypothetical protein